jgi:hypothetical protein
MRYFTRANTSGRVRGGQLTRLFPVLDAPGSDVQIGFALEVNETEDGAALFMLRVNGANLPGRWTVTNGRFHLHVPSRLMPYIDAAKLEPTPRFGNSSFTSSDG